MEPISNDFDIKAIRGALHLSMEALARKLDISERTVRRWEKGLHRAQPRHRAKLAEFVKLEKPTLNWV